MVYGADLNAGTTDDGRLPIDVAANEDIRQAIRDEPERRWNQQPRKRCIDQDQHPHTAAASASAQQEGDEEEQSNTQPKGEGVVADEDQDSESSSDEEDD